MLTTILGLIKGALEGLATLKFFYKEFKELNLNARLDKMEARQQLMHEGYLKMATAQTPEERKDALHSVASSWK